MKEKQSSSENGQVLVILVLVIVGLLAFAALAIDGGLLLADRRGAQNAGDTAVLAGGYRMANTLEDYAKGYSITYLNWSCSSVNEIATLYAKPEAESQAGTNGYPITTNDHITSTLDMDCNPGEDMGSYVDKYLDTTAQITSRVDTAFAHFAFAGPLQNSIIAISRVRPRMPLAFGYAVYAHRDSCPNSSTGGVQVEGNPNAVVSGGGIMSDGCLNLSGSSSTTVTGGFPINYDEDDGYTGGGAVSPTPTGQTNELPEWALLFPEPDCSDLPSASSSGDGTISPGIYSGINVTGGEQLTMNPGLYCFDGNFTINGNNTSFVEGESVTIYMRSGNFTTNGNAAVRLSAPSFVAEDNDGVTGMLIYLGPDNDGEVSLLGNTESYYSGTIYAEHEDSTIEVGGTGDLTSCYNDLPCFGTQLIAGTVRLHGDAVLNVTFNKDAVYYLPARLTLER